MSTALERWQWLEDAVNGRAGLGTPGMRDPGLPCAGFDPGEPEANAICETDGHYLCDECVGRASCECGCGNRPSQCACEYCVMVMTCRDCP